MMEIQTEKLRANIWKEPDGSIVLHFKRYETLKINPISGNVESVITIGSGQIVLDDETARELIIALDAVTG